MNSFMDYVCRGIVRSEDAVRCLNKRVVKLTKSCKQTNAAVLCFGVSSLLMLSLISMQDQEIKALKARVDNLDMNVTDVKNRTDYVVKTMEEQIQQEGA